MRWQDLIATSRLLTRHTGPKHRAAAGFPQKGGEHSVLRRIPCPGKQQRRLSDRSTDKPAPGTHMAAGSAGS